jgi:predicted Zn-dependent peptidase
MRLAVVSLLLLAVQAKDTDASKLLGKRVKKYELDNGIRLLVLKRTGSPTFSAYIRFLVGSSDEEIGQTGTAHILEHMLFKGSEKIGTTDFAKEEKVMLEVEKLGEELDIEKRKGDGADTKKIGKLKKKIAKKLKDQRKHIVKDEISSIYQRNGGSGFNAFTSKDTTTYLIKLPANKLELWAWMESDRLRSPVLREYYAERDVVMEERRRSVDNSPGGTLYEQFLGAAFYAHPYGIPIIGWESDISLLPKRHVRNFLKTYYSPNNMAICIVGDVEPDEVYKMIKKYFEKIPRQEIPERIGTKEPKQLGERRVEVLYDASPQVMIGYHKPSLPHKDDYTFDLITAILTEGRTSRLYSSLVDEKGLAVSVSAWTGPGDRFDNLFSLHAVPRSPHTTAEVEEAIYAEFERLKTEPVSKKELQKVINNIDADYIRQLRSNSGLAHYMSSYEILTGDWRYMERYSEEIKKITAKDIMETAKKYLTKENRTVASLVKKSSAPEGAGGKR